MPDLSMRTAIGNYGYTTDLKNGAATSEKFEMDHVEISPITSVFRQMVRNMEFDLAEMALSTYLCARAHGKAMTGIPIFLVRSFYHGTISCSVQVGNQTAGRLGRAAGRSARLYGNPRCLGPGYPADRLWPRFELGDLGVVRG